MGINTSCKSVDEDKDMKFVLKGAYRSSGIRNAFEDRETSGEQMPDLTIEEFDNKDSRDKEARFLNIKISAKLLDEKGLDTMISLKDLKKVIMALEV